MTRTYVLYFKTCAIFTALTLSACSDQGHEPVDVEPDMSPAGLVMPVQEAIDALIALQVEHACTQVWRCPEASYGDLPFLSRHEDLERCLEDPHNLVFDFLSERYARLARQIDAQNMRYDGARAYSCVTHTRAHLEETLCVGAALQDDSCELIFTGLLSPGASCIEQDECQQGSTCEEALDVISCTGQCTACGVELCAKGTYCDRSGGAARCEPFQATGEPCTTDKACGELHQYGCLVGEGGGRCIELGSRSSSMSCSDDEHCARGLTCKENLCTPVMLKTSEETCSIISVQAGLCRPGLVCAQREPDEAPRCTTARGRGEACTSIASMRARTSM